MMWQINNFEHDTEGVRRKPLEQVRDYQIAVSSILLFEGLYGHELKIGLEMIFFRNQFLAWSFLFGMVQILDFLKFHHMFGPWAIIISRFCAFDLRLSQFNL